MDDVKFFIEKLGHYTMDELTKYVEEHPDFMENLESDEQIDALKAGTYEKIMERIGKLT